MKLLVWGLVLAVIFTTAAAATYSLTHKTPVVAVLPSPIPVVSTIAPTPIPTPDELASSSTNPFDADSDYENPFDDSSYQNPF